MKQIIKIFVSILICLSLTGCGGNSDLPPKITQEDIEEIQQGTNTYSRVKLQIEEYSETVDGERILKPSTLLSYDFNTKEVLGYHTYERDAEGNAIVLEQLTLTREFTDPFDLASSVFEELGFNLEKTVQSEMLQGDNINRCFTLYNGVQQCTVTISDDGSIHSLFFRIANTDTETVDCKYYLFNYLDSAIGSCSCGCGGAIDSCGSDCEIHGGDL